MQKNNLLNFEQNDQKEASEPDHVMLDLIKMSKTAATTKKWAAKVCSQVGNKLRGTVTQRVARPICLTNYRKDI